MISAGAVSRLADRDTMNVFISQDGRLGYILPIEKLMIAGIYTASI
jgi:hypothetical protein